METTLMSQECGTLCNEVTQFSLKFIITSLVLTDKKERKGYEDILITMTFEGNVIKIEKFETNDVGELKLIGRGLNLQLTPTMMSLKLRSCPIMLNLARGCDELGTLKLEITDYFADAVKCEEFSSESVTNELKFVKDEAINAKMNFVLQVSRPAATEASGKLNKLFKDYAKKQTEAVKESHLEAERVENGSYSSCCDDDTESNTTCETDLCPIDEESGVQPSTSFMLSSSTKSKSSRSKCCSDIATSLNLHDYSDGQKTFCAGCGGVSISGVTCDNKSILKSVKTLTNCDSSCKLDDSRNSTVASLCKSSSRHSIGTNISCSPSIPRLCSECFENLSAIPKDADCPKCIHNSQLQRRFISYKSEQVKVQETQKVRDCIKSIFEEIFLEAKDRLVNDWKRLSRKGKKKGRKSINVDRNNKSSDSKLKSMPRCSKMRNAVKQSRKKRKIGLCVKHPGVVQGHKICESGGLLVPKNMGWLWNVGISGLPTVRRGWRPGAVRKTVANIMKNYLNQPEELSHPLKNEDPPTLQVQKKNGEFMIVMNPLQDESKQVGSPIVFKVTKSEEAKKRSIARKILKDSGVAKSCNCCSIKDCNCLNSCEKAYLEYEMKQLSKCFCLKTELNFTDLKDSSDSEIEMEFTPPSAALLKNPCVNRKPKTSVASTQYKTQVLVYEDEISSDSGKKTPKGAKLGAKLSSKRTKSDSKFSSKNHKNETKNEKFSSKLTKDDAVDLKVMAKKQIVKILRNTPAAKSKISCNLKCNNLSDQTNMNQRFTTNYNPMYAQCPPQPPVCANYWSMPQEMPIPIYYM